MLRLREILEVGAARMAASRTLTAAEREALWARLDRRARRRARATTGGSTRGCTWRSPRPPASPSLVPLVAENRMRLNALLDQIPLLPRNIAHSDEQHEAIVMAILAGDGDGAADGDARAPRRVGGAAARLPGLNT